MLTQSTCNSQDTFNILKDKSAILSYADLISLGIETIEDLQGIPNTISRVARRRLETKQNLLKLENKSQFFHKPLEMN